VGVLSLALSIFVQGGFFERTYITVIILLVIGILCENWISLMKQQRFRVTLLLASIVSIIGIVSAWVNQVVWTQCGRIVYMMGIPILTTYLYIITKKTKQILFQCIVVFGTIESIICMIAYLDFPMGTVLVNNRFMGTFQYANATALWLALVLLIILNTPLKWMTRVKLLIVGSLILTFSAGGIFCYVLALILLKKWNELKEMFLMGIPAGMLFSSRSYIGNSYLTVMLLVGILVLSYFYPEIKKFLEKKISTFLMKCICVIAVLTELFCGIYIFGERIRGTGMERIHQMLDGLKILRGHLLLGIGPKQLERYLMKMNVTYKTSLIHNSYIHIAVEIGIIALLILIFVMSIWLKNHKSPNYKWERTVMVVVLLHFFVDISFFFEGVLMTWLICVEKKREEM
jgi:hypothetical protein